MRARRLASAVAVVGVIACALVGAAGYPLYVSPDRDTPDIERPVDAVIALGGLVASAERAQQLADEGIAPRLVLSDAYSGTIPLFTRICDSDPTDFTVTCFRPDPFTTRGEARGIARLAKEEGWRRIIVVAPTYHISRARMIVERCFSGEVDMVDAQAQIGLERWVYEYAYQSAAYVKAYSQDGC